MARKQPVIKTRNLADELTTVLLVRHGQTALNAANLLRGWSDPALDEVGRLQAEALVSVARRFPVCEVVTSPLQRAVETGETIARALELPAHTDPRLVDRNYGLWTGKPVDSIPKMLLTLGGADGVEPWDELCERATQAVVSETDRWQGLCIVVVAHDAVNRAILSCLIEGLGPAQSITQRTGCWNHLERSGAKWTAHVLDALPGEDST